MQYFKGDDLEKKYVESAKPIADTLSMQKDDFFEGCYDCAALGDILVVDNRAPLAMAIKKSIFRGAFNEIFQNFVVAGSFDSYIAVFTKIFGDEVVIEFVVPAPGKLQINITADGFEVFNFQWRQIIDDAYIYGDVLTTDEDNIVFQTLKGFESQYELEQMLFEFVPAGISTDISLEVGA